VTVNDVEKLPVSSELLDSKKWFLIQNSQVVGGCVVIDLPTSARDILEKLVKAGCQAYVVGGFARNILCGQLNPQDDIDIVTNASDSVIRNTLTEAKQNNKKPQLYVFTTDDRRIEIWRSPILSYTQEADARNRDFLPNTLFVDKTGKLFDPFKLVLQKDAEGIKINKELQIVPGKSFEDFPELLLRYTYFEASGLVASHEIEVMKQHITKLDTIPLAEREHLLCKHFMSGKANKSLDILIKYGFLQKLYPAIPVDNLIIMQWLKQELIMIDQRYKIGIPLAKRYIFGLLLLANLDVKVLTKDISLSFYARHLMQICHENDTSELLKYEATLRQLSRSHPVLCLVLSSERSSFAIQYQQSGVFRSTPLAQNANMSPKNEGSGGLSPVTAQIMNH
jgi:tRNA nucleotidyltransferase/poly(A) polymerase